MPQIKISNLPLYTGNTTGAYLVMNNSGQTTTYKVTRESIIGASGTSGTSGSSGSNGSSGSSGAAGASGSSGSSGTSGSNGSSGTSGDSIFAVTGSVWYTTRKVGITGSLNISSSIGGEANYISSFAGNIIYAYGENRITSSMTNDIFALENRLTAANNYMTSIGNFGRNRLTATYNEITGSLTVSGSATITGSLNVVTDIPTNFKNPNNSGSFQLTHGNEITSLVINNQRPGIGEAVVRLGKSNGVYPGNTYNAVFFLKESGSFKFQDTLEVGSPISGFTTRDIFVIKDNLSGSVTFSPLEIKRNTQITGSLNVRSNPLSGVGTIQVFDNFNSSSIRSNVTYYSSELSINTTLSGSTGESIFKLTSFEPTGSRYNGVSFYQSTGSFIMYEEYPSSPGTGISFNPVLILKNSIAPSTISTLEIKRNTSITGSLNISGSTSTSVFVSGSIRVEKPQGSVLLGGVSFPSITITSGSNTSLLGRGTLSLDNVNDKIILVTNSTTGNKTQIQAIDNTDAQRTIVELPCSSSWNDGLTKFKYPVEITGSVNISTVMTLAQQSPLPTGTVGSLAVSGSNLFYHNGSSWSQIN